jgi:phage baseplate assembly protein W
MNIKNLRASGAAVRAVNDLADEITVSLQTDQGSRTMRDGISTRRWTRLFT